MTILLRKLKSVKGAAALIAQRRSVIVSPRLPGLLQTVGAFVLAILLPLLALTLVAFLMHAPDPSGWGFHVADKMGSETSFLVVGAAAIHEVRAKRSKLAKDANEALEAAQAKAKAENRQLNAEELAAQDKFDQQLAAVDQDIKLEEKKLDRERMIAPSSSSDDSGTRRRGNVERQHLRAEDDPRRGFRSHREFLLSVIQNSGLRDRADVEDERLQPLAIADDDKKAKGELAFLMPAGFTPWAAAGSDEQGEYADQFGGYAVPRTRIPGLLQIGFEGDPTEGMTQPIPMETPHVEIMARTDKDHTTSVVGGLTMTRKPETVDPTSSRFQLEMITLKATGLFGLAFATEFLLQDSPSSFAAIIDTGFRTQRSAHILNEKLRGGGGNEYLGVLNSPAKVSVGKVTGQAADTIIGQNVIDMAARVWGPYIWIANHDTKPELYKLNIPVGVTGQMIFQPAREIGFPDMLLGRPVYYSEYAATVGDEGDLNAVNWSQYLEGVYQPLQSAESVHVRFVAHERTFKFWERNCGAPWWRAALTPNRSTKTLSPIVTLAARA